LVLQNIGVYRLLFERQGECVGIKQHNFPGGKMKSISARDPAQVVDYLRQINDPRRIAYGNIRHRLVDVIVIAFMAVLCSYEDYAVIEEFGKLKRDFLKSFPGCRMG
jgi:hypothetical protein